MLGKITVKQLLIKSFNVIKFNPTSDFRTPDILKKYKLIKPLLEIIFRFIFTLVYNGRNEFVFNGKAVNWGFGLACALVYLVYLVVY